jgi:glucose/arabinose dehydrogenase
MSFAGIRTIATLVLVVIADAAAAQQADPFTASYAELCAVCHGANLEGAAQGTALVGAGLRHGDSVDQLAAGIEKGYPQSGMPGWAGKLSDVQIRRMALFIAEKRSGLGYSDFKVEAPPAIPEGIVRSEVHSFRVESVATGIDRLPYSIAPLPDGRILLTEKTRGLRIVAADGTVSDLIRGTPQVFNDGFELPGLRLVYGMGYLLDVAPHPQYRNNGWIYLHYTDRCSNCTEASRKSGLPASMNMLVRGRIRNGEWTDQQTIWRTDVENYTVMPDMAAGGRIAFDDKGHVFISVGIKGGSEYAGIQDLSLPYGKIHRMNDDGSIPADNPFVRIQGALASIWTYGHRTPQGLEFDLRTGQLWETEMGQRGGDEVNLLTRGRNYGWPLTSRGMTYEGTPVEYGKQLGIAFDAKDIEQPKVDLTPSPAVSSFHFYDGTAFPRWRRSMLVGTLKATELYRMVIKGDRVVHTETLLEGLGRIRDVEVGQDGLVYLLLEHASGGRIVRLVPTNRR